MLTINQLSIAASNLAPLWQRGGRCSRARAQAISAQLTLTQQRNAKADRSHRKRKLHKLHELGIKLKDLCRCRRDSS